MGVEITGRGVSGSGRTSGFGRTGSGSARFLTSGTTGGDGGAVTRGANVAVRMRVAAGAGAPGTQAGKQQHERVQHERSQHARHERTVLRARTEHGG